MRLKVQKEEQLCKGRQVIWHIGSHRRRMNSAWEILELDDCVIKGSSGAGRGKSTPGREYSTYVSSEVGTR